MKSSMVGHTCIMVWAPTGMYLNTYAHAKSHRYHQPSQLQMIGTESYRISIEIAEPSVSNSSESEPQEVPSIDYRKSPISVTVIDNPMESAGTDQNTIEPLRARQLGEGVIRLFRDFEDEECDPAKNEQLSNPGDDSMVSIIALPTYFTATDLLGYIGDYYMEYITHIRILKSEKPNRFLVLIKFKDVVKAAEFQYHFDGKQFNSMEPETCHVVFVKSVIFDSLDSAKGDILIPFLLRDPFTTSNTPSSVTPDSSPQTSNVGGFDDRKTAIELPTCPVCLERLDHEITGLLTIPCQHTFHCLCLSKWKDDTCPVCRYTNNVSNLKIRRSVRRLLQINSRMQQQQQQQETNLETMEQCMGCSATSDLWVCLVCGNIGCSRYAPEQHSLKHFVDTGHCFAMEVATSRVWDYAGDGYVHRLIANEADGKIVELPEKSSSEVKSKTDNDALEYSDLLMSQLISQREYYELLLNEKDRTGEFRLRRGSSIAEGRRMSELEGRRMSELERKPERDGSKVSELDQKVAELSEKVNKLTSNVVPALQQKIDMKNTSLRIAAKELSELSALNEGLSKKVDFLTQQNAEFKAQNEDLNDQVKDLMFYLESQQKFKDQPDDVKEGTIVIQQQPKSKKKKGKR